MSDNIDRRAEWECISAAIAGAGRTILSFCNSEDFVDPINSNIVWAIDQIVSEDQDVNISSILDILRLHNRLSEDTLAYIENATSITNVNAEISAKLVGELGARRRMSALLKTTADKLDQGQLTSNDAAENITSDIFQIGASGGNPSVDIAEGSDMMDIELEKLAAGSIVGYTTSLPTVDQHLMGVLNTETVIVTGPPGALKSLVGQKMILANLDRGVKCGVYTLEMPILQWIKRAIAMKSQILSNANKLRGTMEEGVCSLSDEEFQEVAQLNAAIKQQYAGKLFIDDQRFSLYQIQEDMLRRAETNGVTLFLVDYAQLISHGDGGNRVNELGYISRSFKTFAMNHNVAVVLVAKMNKAGAGAAFKGDEVYGTEIEGSGSFEYDASIILSMMMRKPELICLCPPEVLHEYKIKNKKPKHVSNEFLTCSDCHGPIVKSDKRMGWISIPKSRDGAVDDKIRLVFDGPRLKLEEVNING